MSTAKGIYSSTWVIRKKLQGKKISDITSDDVVVSGDDVDEIKNNDFYLRRALGKSVKELDAEKLKQYTVIEVKLIKKIGEQNHG